VNNDDDLWPIKNLDGISRIRTDVEIGLLMKLADIVGYIKVGRFRPFMGHKGP
jgi:hypothetical protein